MLNAFARLLNPILLSVGSAGYGDYYWVLDQAEIAIDVMFDTRPELLEIWPDLVGHASLNMSSEDVLGFLGRKLHPSLQAQVVGDRRTESLCTVTSRRGPYRSPAMGRGLARYLTHPVIIGDME